MDGRSLHFFANCEMKNNITNKNSLSMIENNNVSEIIQKLINYNADTNLYIEEHTFQKDCYLELFHTKPFQTGELYF